MATYYEYITLEDFRRAKMPNEALLTNGTGDGTVILDFIKEVSKIINAKAGRHFVPAIATRYFDAARDVSEDGLLLKVSPFDLLAVGTITNGDTTSVTSTKYAFEPRHSPPYWGLKLKSSQGITWTYTDDPEDAITLTSATWGWHDDYANAWESLTTLGASLTNSATSATLAAATGNPGELWKIDSEFVYLSARSSTTATIVRGVNGSTAAAHDNGAAISRWVVARDVAGLCKAATIIKYAIRENPQIETITVDNHVVSVPKDVNAYIETEIMRLGLVRR